MLFLNNIILTQSIIYIININKHTHLSIHAIKVYPNSILVETKLTNYKTL